jgi:dihydrofolate reductase
LLAADLVDEIRTFTFPVLLGKGKRLFDESSQPHAFRLTHSAVSPNGVIAATYVRDGEVKTATVGVRGSRRARSWRGARNSSAKAS